MRRERSGGVFSVGGVPRRRSAARRYAVTLHIIPNLITITVGDDVQLGVKSMFPPAQ